MGRLKKPPALPFAALHHLLWDYGIVFALRRDTAAVAPGGRRSLYGSITLAAGLGGGDYSDVYTWLDPQRICYGFGYGSPWSLAGLIYTPEGAVLTVVSPTVATLRRGGRSDS